MHGGFFSSPPSAKRAWGILAAFVDHGYADTWPTSVGELRARGLALMPYPGPSDTIRLAIIVPDGVARVTVGAVSLGGQQWLENVTATAHDSVAVLEMNTPGSRFDGLAHTAAQMTWFDRARCGHQAR